MAGGGDQITIIEKVGIAISSMTAIATVCLTIATFSQGQRINNLSNHFEQEKFFTETLSDAIEHFAKEDEISQRLATLSLANSAKTPKQIKATLQVIIIASARSDKISEISNDQKGETSYELLNLILETDQEKKKQFLLYLDDEEIKNTILLFRPIPPPRKDEETEVTATLPPSDQPQSEEDKNSLKNKNQQIFIDRINNLVADIYSNTRSTRLAAVGELSKPQWREYDQIMIDAIMKEFEKNIDKYQNGSAYAYGISKRLD